MTEPTEFFYDPNEPLLDRFETLWGQPNAPSIEALLDEVSPEYRDALFTRLLEIDIELSLQRRLPCTIEHYLPRFSGKEDEIREVFQKVSGYTVFRKHGIKNYTLYEEIGRGGMGVVYRARHNRLGTASAVKIMRKDLVDDPQAMDRFRAEVVMMGKAAALRHPNLVHALDADIAEDGSPYLVMEFLDGISVQQLIDDRFSGRFSGMSRKAWIEQSCYIISEAAKGLQAIHDAGMVHRDIKPGNLMLLSDGSVKILDLGLSKLLHRDDAPDMEYLTRRGDYFGTQGYSAPEQRHDSSQADIRSDIYSLGCTFYKLLTGRLPLESDTNGDIPAKLYPIVKKMYELEPSSRFQVPQEIVDQLVRHHSKKTRPFSKAGTRSSFFDAILAVFLFLTGVLVAVASAHFFTSEKKTAPVMPVRVDVRKFVPEEIPPTVDFPAATFASQLAEAVEMRYQGNTDMAESVLEKLLRKINDSAPATPTPTAAVQVLSAQTLTALGDCVFFGGLASEVVATHQTRRMMEYYREALQHAEACQLPLESELLRKKLAVVSLLQGEIVEIAEWLNPPATDQEDDMRPDLFHSLVKSLLDFKTNESVLRAFVENLDLASNYRLLAREAREIRLFALEFLIHHDLRHGNREKLDEDIRLLDAILLDPYPDDDFSVYMNRFFDLAIRCSPPNDHRRLTRYLLRLRSPWTSGTRPKIMDESSFVLFYFSPHPDCNGFVVYNAADRTDSRRYDFPFDRRFLKNFISTKGKDDSLELPDELVTLIRSDIAKETPIILSWDDSPCWVFRKDALFNEEWPFEKSIGIDEILGKLK